MSRPWVIASGHEVTSNAGGEVLRAGGNAYDALVAAYLTACTAEPAMASMGAGALIMHQSTGSKVMFTDAFCQTPAHKANGRSTIPVTVSWDSVDEIYHTGAASVAVPGVMKGIWKLHSRHGHMSWRECCMLASDIARDGVALNGFQHLDINLLRDIFAQAKDLATAVLDDDLKVKSIGSLIRIPHQAETIEVVAHEGVDILYKGEIAQAISEVISDQGHLNLSDLQSYKSVDTAPLSFTWRDRTIYSPDHPSLGGYILAALLHGIGSQDQLIESIEKVRACGTDLSALSKLSRLSSRASHQTIAGGTSHMSIADAMGNHICMSFSLGEGSGVVVPGTGIHLNNMLGEPSLLPDGIDSWITGSRLRSMMTPIIAVRGDHALLAGTGGADRIPHVLAQFLLHYQATDHLEEAIRAPRCNLAHGTFHTEPGWSAVVPRSVTHNPWKKRNMYFGGVHAVAVDNDHATGAADARREGYILRGQ